MWRFRCSLEEILERQLLIRGRAFATFSTIEKALAGRMLCRLVLGQCPSRSGFTPIMRKRMADQYSTIQAMLLGSVYKLNMELFT